MSVGAHALRLALFLPHPLLTSVRAPRGDRFLGRWSHAKTRRREGTLNEGHKKYDGYGNRGSKSDTSSGNFASYSLLFAPSRLRVRLHFFAFDCTPMGEMYRETRSHPRGSTSRWSHAKTRRREGTLNEGHKKYDGYGNRGPKSDTSSGNFASYSLLFAPSRLRVRLHFFAFDCIPMGGMYRETRWRFTPDEAVSTHFARQLTSGAGAAIDRSPAEPAAATSRQAQEPEKFQ